MYGASLIYRKISIDFVLIANPDFYLFLTAMD